MISSKFNTISHRIVVVEDSQALNELLCEALLRAGFQVEGFLDAESLAEFAHFKDTDVLILDVQLPGETGLQLAKRLRPLMPGLGILMLTTRITNQNRIEGYESGADYYLPKPISPEELVGAVNSLIRRKSKLTKEIDLTPERCKLSTFNYTLSCGDYSIRLSEAEVLILVALASAPDKKREHWQLMELLCKEADLATRGSLDVRISRLRGRLSKLDAGKNSIVSIRGFGYKLGLDLEII